MSKFLNWDDYFAFINFRLLIFKQKQFVQFADETFAVKHKSRGMIGMANSGPHTNQSQFYVTLEAKPYLDKKYVCFGTVIEGTAILNDLEQVDTFNERPTKPITILDCGKFQDHLIE